MDVKTQVVLVECTKASDEGTMTFPDVVGKLMAIGVERYYADLVRGERIYYMPDGDSFLVPSSAVEGAFAERFSPDDVEAAIRKSQKGAITYKTFCTQVAAAGCMSYLVSLAGKRAVYSGRTGECHVEAFPR